jgi:hypothetical protein
MRKATIVLIVFVMLAGLVFAQLAATPISVKILPDDQTLLSMGATKSFNVSEIKCDNLTNGTCSFSAHFEQISSQMNTQTFSVPIKECLKYAEINFKNPYRLPKCLEYHIKTEQELSEWRATKISEYLNNEIKNLKREALKPVMVQGTTVTIVTK